jgi:hypothetical protein
MPRAYWPLQSKIRDTAHAHVRRDAEAVVEAVRVLEPRPGARGAPAEGGGDVRAVSGAVAGIELRRVLERVGEARRGRPSAVEVRMRPGRRRQDARVEAGVDDVDDEVREQLRLEAQLVEPPLVRRPAQGPVACVEHAGEDEPGRLVEGLGGLRGLDRDDARVAGELAGLGPGECHAGRGNAFAATVAPTGVPAPAASLRASAPSAPVSVDTASGRSPPAVLVSSLSAAV